MSLDALNWAAKQDTGHSQAKLILMGLARYADRQGRAWPSVAELSAFSNVHRKGVMKMLTKLKRQGLIDDTGDRRGQTSQVKVWQLQLQQESLKLPASKRQKRPSLKDSSKGAKGAAQRDTIAGGQQFHGGDSSPPTKESLSGNGPNSGTVPIQTGKSPRGGTRNKSEEEEGESANAASPAARGDSKKVFDAWNTMAAAHHLPVAKVLTEDRRKKLRARIKEHGADAIIDAIATIPASTFLMGGGPRGWRADFDWLLIAARLNRLVEGAYSDSEKGAPGRADRPLYETVMEGSS